MAVPSKPDPIVIDIPDPSLVVLIGAAGSGKSTFAARHFSPDEVLSSDAFRALIRGDPADQTATRPAFAALHRALASRMVRRQLTVIDATNVQPHARRALVSRATGAEIPAIAIVLDLGPDVVLARNAARTSGAVVPEPAVLAQLDALAAARPGDRSPWEGFVKVIRIHTPAEIDGVVVRRLVTP
jgi:predicted kinase